LVHAPPHQSIRAPYTEGVSPYQYLSVFGSHLRNFDEIEHFWAAIAANHYSLHERFPSRAHVATIPVHRNEANSSAAVTAR
jgi:hypothetical protein